MADGAKGAPDAALHAKALRDMRAWLVKLLLRHSAELEAAAYHVGKW
jgi:hypothetical protein